MKKTIININDFGKVGARTIRATWTHEVVEDLNLHHIDIEKELEYILKEQFRIDRTIKRKKTINKIFQKSKT